MPKPRRAGLILGAAGLVAILIGLGAYALLRGGDSSNSASIGHDLLAETGSSTPDLQKLNQLTWQDIEATAEGSCADPKRVEEVVLASVTSTNPPTRFLRGLLLLAKGDRAGCLQAFQSVPVQQLPANFLYAPYRVFAELHPEKPNPYRPPLVRAANQGQLSPLVEARVMAREANVEKAMQGYMGSDPAQWTAYDLEIFPLLLRHAGFGYEAQRLLRSALNGGRVKPELRPRIEALGYDSVTNAAPSPTFKPDFAKLLQTSPESRELAGKVAIQQLEVRRQFLQKQYPQLLRDHEEAHPPTLPDETVLLLTLSAAKLTNTPALDRWSQELRRRYPQPEVQSWLATLKPATK